jgi:hypothetical protein
MDSGRTTIEDLAEVVRLHDLVTLRAALHRGADGDEAADLDETSGAERPWGLVHADVTMYDEPGHLGLPPMSRLVRGCGATPGTPSWSSACPAPSSPR